MHIPSADRSKEWADHRAKFAEHVTPRMIDAVGTKFGPRLMASQDKYFNDIPLREWDRFSFIAMRKGFSLSDQVCTVKEAARQWVERQTG